MATEISSKYRFEVFIIAVIAVITVTLLWSFCVISQQSRLAELHGKHAFAMNQLQWIDKKWRQTRMLGVKLEDRARMLEQREAQLPSIAEARAKLQRMFDSFGSARGEVKVDDSCKPEIIAGGLPQNFPYHWAVIHIKGTAPSHDIGSFMTNLKNAFPYFRVQNVVMTPTIALPEKTEQLAFNIDLVTPVLTSNN